jgi:oligoribonuclease
MSKILVCLDLEMTGLESHDEILEVACILTDMNLSEIGEGFAQVVGSTKLKLQAMQEVCINMHQSSGLWDDVLSSTLSISEVEQNLIQYVINLTSAHDELILCGNSIHVDRTFIKKYMPTFDKLLHYRMLDVTSIAILMQSISSDYKSFVKAKSHRALDDIRESIGELAYYKSIIQHD